MWYLQVAQASMYASRLVDSGRMQAAPNSSDVRQDTVMWVPSITAQLDASNSAAKHAGAGAEITGVDGNMGKQGLEPCTNLGSVGRKIERWAENKDSNDATHSESAHLADAFQG